MTDDDVERSIRSDTCWQRPTWRFGSWQAAENRLKQRIHDEFIASGAERGRRHEDPEASPDLPTGITKEVQEALQTLDLTPPVAFDAVKARYKDLVKRHHPDANGGSRDAEERLKSINRAYSTLKAAYAD